MDGVPRESITYDGGSWISTQPMSSMYSTLVAVNV